MSQVLTIGHSTQSTAKFVELLRAHEINHVVDIRTVPRSRHNPHFNREILPAALDPAGVTYEHMGGLGGLRTPDFRSSLNNGWRKASFRGYADYMQSAEFEHNVAQLLDRAETRSVVIMCAEAMPWRCHRSLIADAIIVRGIFVAHVVDNERPRPHALTHFARVEGTRVSYPAVNPELPF